MAFVLVEWPEENRFSIVPISMAKKREDLKVGVYCKFKWKEGKKRTMIYPGLVQAYDHLFSGQQSPGPPQNKMFQTEDFRFPTNNDQNEKHGSVGSSVSSMQKPDHTFGRMKNVTPKSLQVKNVIIFRINYASSFNLHNFQQTSMIPDDGEEEIDASVKMVGQSAREFTLSKHPDVLKTRLVDAINDKCANFCRGYGKK